MRQRDKLIEKLQPWAELLQDLCRATGRPWLGCWPPWRRPSLGPLTASSDSLPGRPSSPLANSTGEEEDEDSARVKVFGTTV